MPCTTFGVFQNGDNPKDSISREARIIVYSSKDIDIYRGNEREKKRRIKTKNKLITYQLHNYFLKILVLVHRTEL